MKLTWRVPAWIMLCMSWSLLNMGLFKLALLNHCRWVRLKKIDLFILLYTLCFAGFHLGHILELEDYFIFIKLIIKKFIKHDSIFSRHVGKQRNKWKQLVMVGFKLIWCSAPYLNSRIMASWDYLIYFLATV